MSLEQLGAGQPAEGFWLLADPAQEILIEERPRFSHLAPVPLRQLGNETIAAGESYQTVTEHRLP